MMALAKTIVVVSEHVDVHDLSEVAWRATGNVDPKRDITFSEGPVDALDHAAPQALFGSKMGIDATRKIEGEGHNRPRPEDITMSPEVIQRVNTIWSELGIG